MVHMFIECLYCRTSYPAAFAPYCTWTSHACSYTLLFVCMCSFGDELRMITDKVKLPTIYHFWCLADIDFGCLLISGAMRSRHRQEDNLPEGCVALHVYRVAFDGPQSIQLR